MSHVNNVLDFMDKIYLNLEKEVEEALKMIANSKLLEEIIRIGKDAAYNQVYNPTNLVWEYSRHKKILSYTQYILILEENKNNSKDEYNMLGGNNLVEKKTKISVNKTMDKPKEEEMIVEDNNSLDNYKEEDIDNINSELEEIKYENSLLEKRIEELVNAKYYQNYSKNILKLRNIFIYYYYL